MTRHWKGSHPRRHLRDWAGYWRGRCPTTQGSMLRLRQRPRRRVSGQESTACMDTGKKSKHRAKIHNRKGGRAGSGLTAGDVGEYAGLVGEYCIGDTGRSTVEFPLLLHLRLVLLPLISPRGTSANRLGSSASTAVAVTERGASCSARERQTRAPHRWRGRRIGRRRGRVRG